ncbi:MAG: hypothetical protein IKY57_01650 [Alistipes sp.]|nr:hypothetical protein [Alistipes sp.]
MQEKCKNLSGLNDLVINKTTIKDVFQNYSKEYIKEEMGWRPNVDNRYDRSYSRISKIAKWRMLKIENFDYRFTYGDVELDFYQDTLVQISFRYQSDSKQLPEYFANQYGFGCPVTEDYLSSLPIGYGTAFDDHWPGVSAYRKYVNGDIHMVVSGKYWDVIICHKPKFSKMSDEIESAWFSTSTPRDDKKSSGHNSMDADDEEYWKSVNREKALKDAGMDEAAKIERKARQNYLKGGGYTSPNGGSQVHYQGSKEQQDHLEEMRRRGW